MHEARLALSFAADNTGSNIAARMAIMAMTTSSSIKVNAPEGNPDRLFVFTFFTDAQIYPIL